MGIAGVGGREEATAQNTQVTGRRVIAASIDLVLIWVAALMVATLMAGVVAPGDWAAVAAFVTVTFLDLVVLQGRTGQSLGKNLLNIRVVQEGTNRAPGLRAALLRTLMLFTLDGLGTGLIGLAAILISRKNQRLGDMLARTLVVRA